MKVVEYTVVITFPDDKVMDVDTICEILFNHPILKDCLVTVNSRMFVEKTSIAHNCEEFRTYLKPCNNCPQCKDDPRKCDLVVYGICAVCGELVK